MANVLANVTLGESAGAFGLICAGVVISVVLPPLSTYVRSQFGSTTAPAINFKKYGALLAFSLITALLVLAGYRAMNPNTSITWYAALLAGYTWDATLQKIGLDPR